MIFTDKETARKFRTKAREDLVEDVVRIALNVVDDCEYLSEMNPELLREVLSNGIRHELSESRLYNTLIHRSGIVFGAREDEPVHDMIVYFDNDAEEEFRIASVMRENRSRLIGGIDIRNGGIHT